MEKLGVKVIANYRVGDERTFDIACSGIKRHTAIAVGTIGCMDNSPDEKILTDSILHAIEELCPNIIVIYGKTPSKITEACYNKDIKLIRFDGETAIFHNRKGGC